MAENTVKDYEIQHTVLVTPRLHIGGDLTTALRKLVEGQVGDSFVTPKVTSSVNLAAKNLGLEVMCRIENLSERNPKLRRYRVWRSDGYDEAKINDIIRLRKQGLPIPPRKECVPLTKEQRAKKKGR